MPIEMTEKTGNKLRRYADWCRVAREVKRRINEGNDRFTVGIGGFEVKFDGRKGLKDEGK